MSIDHVKRLKRLVPPIDQPSHEMDWALAEEIFGQPFPTDFKQMVSLYRDSLWCDLFRAIYPDTETRESCEMSREKVLRILAAIYSANLWDKEGNLVRIPPYPSPEGLLPCLIDTNSDVVCWHTVGEPDSWTTVLYQEGNLFFYPTDVTQLIHDWIQQIPPAAEVWGKPDPRNLRVSR